jgi:hypothetical protein
VNEQKFEYNAFCEICGKEFIRDWWEDLPPPANRCNHICIDCCINNLCTGCTDKDDMFFVWDIRKNRLLKLKGDKK